MSAFTDCNLWKRAGLPCQLSTEPHCQHPALRGPGAERPPWWRGSTGRGRHRELFWAAGRTSAAYSDSCGHRTRSVRKKFAPLFYRQAEKLPPLPPSAQPQPDGDAAPPRSAAPAGTSATGCPSLAAAHAPGAEAGGTGSSCRPVWIRVRACARRAGLTACFRLCRTRPPAKHDPGGCYGVEFCARARRECAGEARVVAEPDLGRAARRWSEAGGERASRPGLRARSLGGVLAVPCLPPTEARARLTEVPLWGVSLSCSAPGAPRDLSQGAVVGAT